MRALIVASVVLLGACATAGKSGDGPAASIAGCTEADLRPLRAEIARTQTLLDEADALAQRQPTEANDARAAEAAADFAMANADLDATRVDCMESAR